MLNVVINLFCWNLLLCTYQRKKKNYLNRFAFLCCMYTVVHWGPLSYIQVLGVHRNYVSGNFLNNILREEGGFEYKKAIVDSIVISHKRYIDDKKSGLFQLFVFNVSNVDGYFESLHHNSGSNCMVWNRCYMDPNLTIESSIAHKRLTRPKIRLNRVSQSPMILSTLLKFEIVQMISMVDMYQFSLFSIFWFM